MEVPDLGDVSDASIPYPPDQAITCYTSSSEREFRALRAQALQIIVLPLLHHKSQIALSEPLECIPSTHHIRVVSSYVLGRSRDPALLSAKPPLFLGI